MIAGEDAEPARIDGQAFRKPELERKVSHRERRLCVHEPRMALVVLAIGRPRTVKCLANVLTFAGALHAVLRQDPDERFRAKAFSVAAWSLALQRPDLVSLQRTGHPTSIEALGAAIPRALSDPTQAGGS